jgi:hypothetical protein
VEGTLRFSPDGTTVAYVASIEGTLHPVIGEKPGRSYAHVEPPVIDASGQHVAFRAIDAGGRSDPRWVVLHDGREHAKEDWIGAVSLSPVDGTPAYWAALGRSTNADGSYSYGPYVLCFGKKRSDKMQSSDDVLAPAFTADGERVYSAGTKRDRWSVLWFDRRGRDGEIDLGNVLEAWPRADGREVVCTVSDRDHFFVERWSVPEKGEPQVLARLGQEFADAGSPVYAPAGDRIAFKVSNGEKLGVALSVDETAECAYDFVDDLAFDPAGNSVAFVAATGCTVDDLGSEPGEAAVRWRVLEDMVDADEGRWSLVIGADRGPEHDRARSPTWSPDGSRIAYAARDGDEWRVLVHDGPSSPPCDDLAQLVWAPDSRAVWYGSRRDRDLCWSSLAVD